MFISACTSIKLLEQESNKLLGFGADDVCTFSPEEMVMPRYLTPSTISPFSEIGCLFLENTMVLGFEGLNVGQLLLAHFPSALRLCCKSCLIGLYKRIHQHT